MYDIERRNICLMVYAEAADPAVVRAAVRVEYPAADPAAVPVECLAAVRAAVPAECPAAVPVAGPAVPAVSRGEVSPAEASRQEEGASRGFSFTLFTTASRITDAII
jgi:hypothetical protein